MKTNYFFFILLIVVSIFSSNQLFAQADRDSTETNDGRVYIVITYNGGEFMGVILKEDDKEVTINTKDRGKITIPKYEIKEMRLLESAELSAKGEYMPGEGFSSRYFITTNGLPIKKGEHYGVFNLYGPEVHFAVAKNLSLGIMTSWLAVPVIGSVKYSFVLGENVYLGIGALVGTGSWGYPDVGLALPYSALTIGNEKINLNLSAGYGVSYFEEESSGTGLYSVGFMSKIGKKVSFIFDSFFFTYDRTSTNGNYNYNTGYYSYNTVTEKRVGGSIIPGLRIEGRHDSAFQFGFLGAFADDVWAPLPIPMISWFRKF